MHRKASGKNYFKQSGYPVTAVRVRIDEGARSSHPHDLTELEHDHDFRELVLVIRGSAGHRVQGQDFRVQAGDVYILRERSRHYFFDIKELDLINVMYDARRLPLPMDQLRQLPGFSALFLLEPEYRKRHQFSSRLQLDRPALDHVRALGEDMVREAAGNNPGRQVMLLSRLLELMIFLSRQYGQSTVSQSRALLRLGNVIGALERDYTRPWRIAEMAKLAGMSRSTFLRSFNVAIGQSPARFLVERRLAAAERMLREADEKITTIALETGFSDSNYFARQFRARFGVSPSSYRRSR